jgi:hypothetical protein
MNVPWASAQACSCLFPLWASRRTRQRDLPPTRVERIGPMPPLTRGSGRVGHWRVGPMRRLAMLRGLGRSSNWSGEWRLPLRNEPQSSGLDGLGKEEQQGRGLVMGTGQASGRSRGGERRVEATVTEGAAVKRTGWAGERGAAGARALSWEPMGEWPEHGAARVGRAEGGGSVLLVTDAHGR